MEINADFAAPALVRTGTLEWTPSPMKGVERRMLDRIGGEVARATSIVRYAAGSAFAQHTHRGGEEFIVLDGVFQDEHSDYPEGTYVRNPVGTHHVPRSDQGCTIFVKLWQFDPEDQSQIAVDLNALPLTSDSERAGVRSAVLADRDYEHVSLEQWDAGAACLLREDAGFELLLLSGSLMLDGQVYSKHDWIRWPAGKAAPITAGDDGVRLWIKRGALGEIQVPGGA